ncbi:MAG: glycosyltransferase [Rhodothermaceae bacterium]
MLDCMESLDKIDYPKEKIELLVVNDNSTDATQEIIEEFTKGKSKFISLKSRKSIGELKGKANAIANAMEIATGEVIFTTDADCIVKPDWVKTILSYYDDDVAGVFGFTHQPGKSIFTKMQSADLIYLLTVSSGRMNMDSPMSCIGNNMSYKRSVYDEVGGYEAIPFSVTEDYRLLREMIKLDKYKFRYPVDVNALVTTKPCPDLKTLYRQKKRWSVGGLEAGRQGFSAMLAGYFGNFLVLVLPFVFSWVTLGLVLTRFISDYLFLKSMHKKLELEFSVIKLIYFEFYFFIYALLTPPVVITSRNIVWKDSKFKR